MFLLSCSTTTNHTDRMKSRLPHLVVAFLAFAVESLQDFRHCELQALHLWVWQKKVRFNHRQRKRVITVLGKVSLSPSKPQLDTQPKPTKFFWILARFGDVEWSAVFVFSLPLTSAANHHLKERESLMHGKTASFKVRGHVQGHPLFPSFCKSRLWHITSTELQSFAVFFRIRRQSPENHRLPSVSKLIPSCHTSKASKKIKFYDTFWKRRWICAQIFHGCFAIV